MNLGTTFSHFCALILRVKRRLEGATLMFPHHYASFGYFLQPDHRN